MKLADTHGSAAAISKTQSLEFWDEKPAEQKLKSLAGYLQDVSIFPNIITSLLTRPKVHSATLT